MRAILALIFVVAVATGLNAEGGSIGGTLPPPSEPTGALDTGSPAAGNACPETGAVVGLDPHGDGFLSVRDGPGGKSSAEIDRIANGQPLAVCERRGAWLAVLYDRAGRDCRSGTRSCRSGWVFSRYVRIAEPPPTGGPLACEALWTRRNIIYKEAGYCFRTPRAITAFGNAGCRYDRLDDVPLSAKARLAVSSIVAEERAAGCAP